MNAIKPYARIAAFFRKATLVPVMASLVSVGIVSDACGADSFSGRSEKDDPAWTAFLDMIEAYQAGHDVGAVAAGERWKALNVHDDKTYWQASAIIAELQRRKKAGTFGKPAREVSPKGFKDWDTAKRVAHLIELLEDVDAMQYSYPGWVELALDERVDALIEIGDLAVPALIETIEKDERLTRSVHAWRPWDHHRTVLSVREAALEAVTNIIKTHFYGIGSTGASFTLYGSTAVKETVVALTAYWKKYGEFPFPKRMMKVLSNPSGDCETARESVYNLAHLGEKYRYSGGFFITFGDGKGRHSEGSLITYGSLGDHSLWRRYGQIRPSKRPEVRNLIEQFSDPTAAEAMLAAMDRHLQHDETERHTKGYTSDPRKIEDAYLGAILRLGDKRLAPSLIERYHSTTDSDLRRKFACAASQLGDATAVKEYARDLEAGKIELPPGREDVLPAMRELQPDITELREIVSDLGKVLIPETDRALEAMIDPKHPYYRLLSRQLLYGIYWHPGNAIWVAHPYCLKLLRRELENTDLTGGEYRMNGGNVEHVPGVGGMTWVQRPWILADSNARNEQAKERRCDCAAMQLHELLVDLPEYHPLRKDAPARLEALKKKLDSFRWGYRQVTPDEQKAFHTSVWHAAYLPLPSPDNATEVEGN